MISNFANILANRCKSNNIYKRERFNTSDIAITDTRTAGPTAMAKIHRIQDLSFKLLNLLFLLVAFFD